MSGALQNKLRAQLVYSLLQRTQRRYELQAKFKEDYEQTLKQAKEDITKKHSVPLSEEIADEIRAWFREYQFRTGKFPEFPSEEHGGSRHLLSRQGLIFISCNGSFSI